MEKSCCKHLITVEDFISEQGNAKGYLEYSSTTVRMYRFLVVEGIGPLKSIFNRSKGEVAFINFPLCLKNLGLSSAHTLHDVVTFLISSSDYGKFLLLTQ